MENAMKFETIDNVFEWMRDGYSYSEALTDAMSAYKHSKAQLEKLFDERLWIPEDYVFDNEKDKAYYIALGRIEELLVCHGLIYND